MKNTFSRNAFQDFLIFRRFRRMRALDNGCRSHCERTELATSDTYANDLCLSEFRNKNREFIFLSLEWWLVDAVRAYVVLANGKRRQRDSRKNYFGLSIKAFVVCGGRAVIIMSSSAHASNAYAFQYFESRTAFIAYWNFRWRRQRWQGQTTEWQSKVTKTIEHFE